MYETTLENRIAELALSRGYNAVVARRADADYRSKNLPMVRIAPAEIVDIKKSEGGSGVDIYLSVRVEMVENEPILPPKECDLKRVEMNKALIEIMREVERNEDVELINGMLITEGAISPWWRKVIVRVLKTEIVERQFEVDDAIN